MTVPVPDLSMRLTIEVMTHSPLLLHQRSDFLKAVKELPGSTALVMTMGALHEGHLELVRQGQKLADHVIVTIFVNPTQFAPGEDFEAYPRTLEADMAALLRVGADLVWAPSVEEMYPQPAEITIDPGPVAHHLEGATRPTHFAGVALVVSKVLIMVNPDVALFGEKDAQQLAVIRQVVTDLAIPTRIVGVPIVRASDGLALSSRNAYLSVEGRASALSLSRSLRSGLVFARDEADVTPAAIAAVVYAELTADPTVELDYVAVVQDQGFSPLVVHRSDEIIADVQADEPWNFTKGALRVLVAARVGTTRLIDNCRIDGEAVEL